MENIFNKGEKWKMIKITDRFYITANTNCYTLSEKTKVQDTTSKNYGQEVMKDLGYYCTLESCLKGILKTLTREYISKDEVNSINDLIGRVRLTQEFLESLNLKF